MTVTLLTHARCRSPERQLELDRCLAANAANACIDRIVVFREGPLPDVRAAKVEMVAFPRRLTYAKLFDYASSRFAGRTCLFAHGDVRFDETLGWLDDVDFSHTWLVTGPGDVDGGASPRRPFDAIAFRPPVDRFRSGFTIGAAGAEDRFVRALRQEKLTVRDVRAHVRAFREPAAGERAGERAGGSAAPGPAAPVPRPVPDGPKVFGIGLQRTGTGSFRRALEMLGIPTVGLYGAWFLVKLRDGRLVFEPSVNRTFFAGYADSPVPLYFRELDAMFPGSRFVYTTREPEPWLASVERLFAIKSYWDETPEGPIYNAFHELSYGTADFDRDAFLRGYARHRDAVLDHFKERRGDLLVMDCDEPDKWAKLCPFLDRPVPETPYPHESRKGLRPLWTLRRLLAGRVPRPRAYRARR